MTQVIEAIEQALQEQDIDKVYEHYHHVLCYDSLKWNQMKRFGRFY